MGLIYIVSLNDLQHYLGFYVEIFIVYYFIVMSFIKLNTNNCQSPVVYRSLSQQVELAHHVTIINPHAVRDTDRILRPAA